MPSVSSLQKTPASPGPFLSPPPEVAITNAFERSFDNAVATARTCYSSTGIISEEKVVPSPPADEEIRRKKAEARDRLAQDLYQAGHHTTLQHSSFQFAVSNVSRHFIWSFLHSHPFYNSEQVSQRYVTVKDGSYAIPPLEGEALAVYRKTVESQNAAYRELCEILVPLVEREYFGRRFVTRARRPEPWRKEIQKKAQEIARYALPVATFAYLYHTVSGLTLLRYYRTMGQFDTPMEQRMVVEMMIQRLLEHDPSWKAIMEEPIPQEETVEFGVMASHPTDEDSARDFVAEFDAGLEGRTSKLVDWSAGNETILAQSVREVFGLTRSRMPDEEAIALALDPGRNAYLGETLNTTTHSKLSRALFHPRFTFRKKLSHTADSQNQRHRMTPGSRPIMATHFTGEPDVITPPIVAEDPAVHDVYRRAMDGAWRGIARLRALGVADEHALYLLPNAVAIRFTESTDLLNLRHKLAMRLCYNAQEEIWRASLDEADQICVVNPSIGRYLLPPCTLRLMAKTTPICPEGRRYCGERVWTYSLDQYQRLI